MPRALPHINMLNSRIVTRRGVRRAVTRHAASRRRSPWRAAAHIVPRHGNLPKSRFARRGKSWHAAAHVVSRHGNLPTPFLLNRGTSRHAAAHIVPRHGYLPKSRFTRHGMSWHVAAHVVSRHGNLPKPCLLNLGTSSPVAAHAVSRLGNLPTPCLLNLGTSRPAAGTSQLRGTSSRGTATPRDVAQVIAWHETPCVVSLHEPLSMGMATFLAHVAKHLLFLSLKVEHVGHVWQRFRAGMLQK